MIGICTTQIADIVMAKACVRPLKDTEPKRGPILLEALKVLEDIGERVTPSTKVGLLVSSLKGT